MGTQEKTPAAVLRNHRINLEDFAVTAQRHTRPDEDPVATAVRRIRERLARFPEAGRVSQDAALALAQEAVQELPLTGKERQEALEVFQRAQFGYGPLDALMRDPTVTEILVDGPDHVDVERHGRLETVPEVRWRSNALLHEYVKQLIQHTGRTVDLSHPIVNAEVQGHRVNITAPPVSLQDTINIRKSVIETRRYTPETYVASGAIDAAGMRLLLLLYRAGANMLVCGKTGSGKTTVSRILIEFGARPDTRFIALEDTRELEAQVPRFVSLQTVDRQEFPVTMDDLFAAVKRKRPDRIVIGEVLSGVQATPYLMSIMAGHEGGLGTMHAGTPEDAFHNFVFFLASAGLSVNEAFLMDVLHHAVHVLVFVTKFARGQRRVTRIVAVDPGGAFVDLYRWNFRERRWEWVTPLPERLQELCFISEVPVPTPEDTVALEALRPEALDAWQDDEPESAETEEA